MTKLKGTNAEKWQVEWAKNVEHFDSWTVSSAEQKADRWIFEKAEKEEKLKSKTAERALKVDRFSACTFVGE